MRRQRSTQCYYTRRTVSRPPHRAALQMALIERRRSKRSNEAVVPGVDWRGGSGYRMGLALAAAGRCGATFQGSSSSMRLPAHAGPVTSVGRTPRHGRRSR
ncbi:hypothetical protein PT2222_460011 [Paraburkholderia tropica]